MNRYSIYILKNNKNITENYFKNTEKIINNVIDEALKERETSRGGTN